MNAIRWVLRHGEIGKQSRQRLRDALTLMLEDPDAKVCAVCHLRERLEGHSICERCIPELAPDIAAKVQRG